MTREEIYKHIMIACERTWNDKTCREIKQALEQEPCEDAISRQAVLDLSKFKLHNAYGNVIKETVDIEDVKKLPPVYPSNGKDINVTTTDCISREAVKSYKYHRTMYPNFEDYVDMLPPVSPARPTGKWIYTGDYLTEGMCKCSKCGVELDPSEARNFCPN